MDTSQQDMRAVATDDMQWERRSVDDDMSDNSSDYETISSSSSLDGDDDQAGQLNEDPLGGKEQDAPLILREREEIEAYVKEVLRTPAPPHLEEDSGWSLLQAGTRAPLLTLLATRAVVSV